jgi:glycosyltransferase involved in cell wall biosynthesis
MDKAKDIYFSIVIPARNEAANVRQCIESVLANNPDIGFEVVFADSSTDRTADIVKSLGVRVLEQVPGTISAVRNTGARAVTRGSVLVFMDGDMQVPSDWLDLAKAWFDGGFKGALGFTESAPANAGWIAKTWGDRIHQKLDKVVDAGYLPGRNLFVNRSVYDEIGGFDEALVTNEDKDFSIRVRKAGYKVISIPETRLFHLGYEKDFAEFVRKEFWRQGSSLMAARRDGFSMRAIRAPLFSLWHVAALLAIPIALLAGKCLLAALLFLGWVGPSIIIAKTKLGSNTSLVFTLAFFYLTLVRWTVAGAAVIKQLVDLSFRDNIPAPGKAQTG